MKLNKRILREIKSKMEKRKSGRRIRKGRKRTKKIMLVSLKIMKLRRKSRMMI
jgi:hypothetical protein